MLGFTIASLVLCCVAPAPHVRDLPAAQDITPADEGAVARFRLDGEPAVVTRDELALAVARRHRHSESGQQARDLLIDRHLVRSEAREAGVEPTAEEIETRIERIREELDRAGYTLEQWLEAKRMPWRRFRDHYVALSLAHNRLVMKAMGLEDRSEVTKELLQLWLQEARLRHEVVTEPAELPEGVVARVDDRDFTLLDLGRTMLPNVGPSERERFARRAVLRRCLAAAAREAGIEVSAEEIRAEIARRREQVENDPKYQGVAYEEWLRATQGLTPEELADSPQMLATVQHQKLIDQHHPAEELQRRLQEHRQEVLARHGPKRRVSLILLRAREEPNELVSRTFPEAEQELEELRARLEEPDMNFDKLARLNSEHPLSKTRGGDVGYHARRSDELPEAILAAVFDMELLEVRGPLRVPQGYVLVRLTGLRPAPPDAELIESLRDELGQQLLEEILEDAEMEML